MQLLGVQARIIETLIAEGGEISIARLKSLYTTKGDGYKNAYLVKLGYTEWVRPPHNDVGRAIRLRITERGRALIASP